MQSALTLASRTRSFWLHAIFGERIHRVRRDVASSRKRTFCRALLAAFLFVLAFAPRANAQLPLNAGIAQVSGGFNHTCSLSTAGRVKCWGANRNGQLGDGTLVQRNTAVAALGLTADIAAVASGAFHTCALSNSGGVKCWGFNNDGELGDGSTTQRSFAADVTGLTSGVIAIATGAYHSCALTNAGGVKCWGFNSSGQLGDNTTIARAAPVDVSGLTSGVVSISAGGYYTCAITSSGGAKCWGYNFYGQLGDNTTIDRPLPTDVTGLTSGVAQISAAFQHTCARLQTGGAKCWGYNLGSVGDGTFTQRNAPVDVLGLASGVAKITGGGYQSCAVTSAGSAKCWGYNAFGQLGDGTAITRTSPVDVVGLGSGVAAITSGFYHLCSLSTGGGVKCWGQNYFGKLGNNASTDRLVPTPVIGLGSGVTAVATNSAHSCAVTSGGAKCWGDNAFGQLGDNSTTMRLSQVDVVGLASGVASAAPGAQHTCALTTAGGVKCWGDNAGNQLGDGTNTPRLTAVNVTGLASGVTAIAAGAFHNCALTGTGTVKCWGNNNAGQLGDGTTTARNTAVDVSGLTGAIAISAAANHTCALLSTGSAKCWGENIVGQLGDNTTVQRLLPVDVAAPGVTFTKISTGDFHTCGVTSAGSIKCWGSNAFGGLGDNTFTQRVSPVDVLNLGGTAATVSAGQYHTCARLTSGAAKCWGRNDAGQIGEDTTANRTAPAAVAGLGANVVSIVAGSLTSCAIQTSGALTCWGLNAHGEIGDGTISYQALVGDVLYFPPRVANDLSADGNSDITYRDAAGTAGVVLMNGVTPTAVANVLLAGSGWSVTHIADFDGDGKADLLIKHSDGRIAILLMNGTSVLSSAQLVGAGTGYTAVVTGDFNGDGRADIVLKNTDGSAAVLLMNGVSVLSAGFVLGTGSPWNITHAGDFDGDGRTDLIIRNNDGSAAVLIMNGAVVTGASILLSVGGPWSVTHVADLSGDGKSDVIIKNTDGSTALLLMNGTTVTSAAFLLTPGSPYTVTHVGDFNGDGKADLLIRNTDGSVVILQMNGTVVSAAAFLLLAGSTTTVAQVADYNGDGKSDILLRNADGSATAILMNGSVVSAAGNVWGAGTLVAAP
jgi:alpha-tubulin suppressor-like RCC1 family protein